MIGFRKCKIGTYLFGLKFCLKLDRTGPVTPLALGDFVGSSCVREEESVCPEISVPTTWGSTSSFLSGSHSTAGPFSSAGPHTTFVEAPFAFLEEEDDDGNF